MVKVGITHGDINGIGYEVILKTFGDARMAELCVPVIYGSSKVAAYHRKVLELPMVNMNIISQAEEAGANRVNLINCVEDEIKVELSQSTEVAGAAAFKSLEAATADLRRGAIDVLVTAPINKHNIQSDQFHFPGHTEYLEACCGEENKALMILLNGRLRVALVTGHVPVAQIASQLSIPGILSKLSIFNHSLKQDFGIVKPRIAVLALNPHAGDAGLIGTEEQTIIIPAIKEAEKKGIAAFGPFPADGFFAAGTFAKYDAVLAMYHDQGLAPFKALSGDGVNFTAGLPIVRTSPAHGVGFDIAGQDKADAQAMRNAIYMAMDILRSRELYAEMSADPLQKFKRENGVDVSAADLPETDEM